MFRRTALLASLAMLSAGLASAGAFAQSPPVRVRGTAEAVSADMLTVAMREGSKLEIKLTQPLAVVTLQRVAVADIEPGAFMAIVSKPGTDNLEAVSVTYFPPGAPVPREGQFPWDLPNTTMTNAAVSGAVTSAAGDEVALAFRGRTAKLTIPPGTPVVTQVPGQVADLRPGVPVFLFATKAADGSLSAARITVGKDGVNPAS